MTQDEIIEMADKAGFFVKDKEAYSPSNQEDHELTPYLKAFAHLVAAKEREACAKIAEQKISKTWAAPNSPKKWWELACENIATAIRAREQE